MRFYSEILIQPTQYLNELCQQTYEVFCTDFIYHLARLHNMDWKPIISINPGYNSYLPHPMSPYTKHVKQAVQDIIYSSVLNYEVSYERLVPTEATNKLELYINRVSKVLSKLSSSPVDALFIFLHVGRWTIAFYEHGTKDAAHLAPHLMADALKRVTVNSPMFICQLDKIAQAIVDLFKNEADFGFAEEYYYYCQELNLEANGVDDANLCVCGHCKDVLEGRVERGAEIDGQRENNNAKSDEVIEDDN